MKATKQFHLDEDLAILIARVKGKIAGSAKAGLVYRIFMNHEEKVQFWRLMNRPNMEDATLAVI